MKKSKKVDYLVAVRGVGVWQFDNKKNRQDFIDQISKEGYDWAITEVSR